MSPYESLRACLREDALSPRGARQKREASMRCRIVALNLASFTTASAATLYVGPRHVTMSFTRYSLSNCRTHAQNAHCGASTVHFFPTFARDHSIAWY